MNVQEPIKVRVAADEAQIAEWTNVIGRIAKSSEINQALAWAINRALADIKSVTSKGLRDEYTVKSKAVSDAQKMTKADRSNLSGSVTYTSPGISLQEFKLVPGKIISFKGVPNAARKQLVVEIKKGQQKEYKGGFLQKIQSKEARVYSRRSGASYPVTRQYGPAIAGMLEASGIAERAQESGNAKFSERIDYEIDRMLRR